MNAARIFLSLGTNLGDRSANLRQALALLAPSVQVESVSSIYETAPWGYTDQPPFLNQVLMGQTLLSPLDLLAHLKEIETLLGRTSTFRYGPRLIDLDILFYADLVLDLPSLSIPHPQLHRRAFVLVPLAELAPDLIHPTLGMTIHDLLLEVGAQGIHPYTSDPAQSPITPTRSVP